MPNPQKIHGSATTITWTNQKLARTKNRRAKERKIDAAQSPNDIAGVQKKKKNDTSKRPNTAYKQFRLSATAIGTASPHTSPFGLQGVGGYILSVYI